MDARYDRAAGVRTIAVALGAERARRFGWVLWLLYLVGLIGASVLGYGLPRSLGPWMAVLGVLFVGQYARVLRTADNPTGCWRQIVRLCALWHLMVLGVAISYVLS